LRSNSLRKRRRRDFGGQNRVIARKTIAKQSGGISPAAASKNIAEENQYCLIRLSAQYQ
jgi:hypothetical protein